MRVVAGRLGGRRLSAPADRATRPTGDRTREGIFNALDARRALDGVRGADLFAGTGALGIEAISRGAAHIWFVESAREALAVLRANLAALDVEERATVVGRSVESSAGSLPDDLSLLLADPPYAFDGWVDLGAVLADRAAPDCVLVAESDRAVDPGPRWRVTRSRSYGGTVVTFALLAGADGVPDSARSSVERYADPTAGAHE